jgi:hypothetical protein
MLPYIFYFFLFNLPFCDFATIETFIEIALIFFVIVKKYADANCRRPVLVCVIAFLISATFVGLAIYQSTLIILDTPIWWLYDKIYDFFELIKNNINDFFSLISEFQN